MQVTGRFYAAAAVGALLAACAVVFARPVVLVGSAAIGAWLLARQVSFTRSLLALDRSLDIQVTLDRDRVRTDESVAVTLTVASDRPLPLPVTVEARPPIATRGSAVADRRLELNPGQTESRTTFDVAFGVPGALAFDRSVLSVTDPTRLFTAELDRGPTPSITVDVAAPTDLHIGEGGTRLAAAYGEHEAGRFGAGTEPAELREYQPGDEARHIDWRATARLDRLIVRESEAETDRRTVLVVDHRASTEAGPSGGTILAYLREAALVVLEAAASAGDPISLYTVGDGGLTGETAVATGTEGYRTIRDRLSTLQPTTTTGHDGHGSIRSPAAATRAADRLRGDGSAFATRLRPFLDRGEAYVQRIDEDPMFAAVRRHVARRSGSTFTVIVTDDSRRTELRESVALASRGDGGVAAFVAPSALYDPDGLADLEAAYERYLAFEEFRRELARLPRVNAFEVAPGERLGAILSARRQRRAARTREVRAR